MAPSGEVNAGHWLIQRPVNGIIRIKGFEA
jgi:hypothetical protein